jgi:menaquinone-specific isochorismate synthase
LREPAWANLHSYGATGKSLAPDATRPHALAHEMTGNSAPMAWLTRRDGSVLLGHGPFTESAVPPPDGVAFHVQDYALRSAQPWKIPAWHEHLSFGELAARFPADFPVSVDWRIPDAAPFSVVFQEVMSSIRSGVFEKTVPVVTETGASASPPGGFVVAAMCRQQPPLLSYGWMEQDRGFAGATPELLLSVEDHHLETMALAGTARSEDQDAFAVDEKEIREHEYVAQTLVAKLLDLGTLRRHPREILHLGSIVHFLTRIEVELRGPLPPDELIRRLHPTPALGPLPRTDVTLSKLLEWRQRLGCPDAFGAPFGAWENGRFCCVVAIRGVWWSDLEIRIPSGCGVIEASRLVNEWRELRLKREAVKNCLMAQV